MYHNTISIWKISYLFIDSINRLYYHLFLLQLQPFTKGLRNYSNVAPTTKLFIDGQFVESKSSDWVDLHNPATNEVVTRVPLTTMEEMEAAVQSCKAAYDSWSKTTVLTRQTYMLKLQALIRRDLKKIAENITTEQGKTLVDSEGDVMRGIRK